ncbi:hypothetical protein [Candidatus Enterovibrio altilux]|uniref:Mobile element protein n=1 Tax=Candidatus Enterovibrio altilux TaxID=1927128 RepID=A0A291B999_9GAMM|nr:hypothetical protein [Candidatus Enterovibrio luxaltus]ATF09557.1 hypothetical protein BTN50_1056 [Candidatus Enterovibrio luxaltus]
MVSKKHSFEGKQPVWSKLHLAVDINMDEVIAVELNSSKVVNGAVLSKLFKYILYKINEI